jgi:N-hydroxyarylamine O-acetyltransferase
MLDAATRDRLLRRIGLDETPPADAAVHRAFVGSVPYEALAVQLGECEPLDPAALVERMLAGGRGGYCFEINTVLLMLLEALGFSVERHQSIVGERDALERGEATNHLALVAATPEGERFIAEAGWGEGPLDPLPLAAGPVTAGAFTYGIERDGDGWWVTQHEHGSTPGFHFADAVATLADFAPHHHRLSTAPDSSFVKTLVVQRPADDRIATLRARTFFVDGPDRRERTVIDDAGTFATVLDERFGINPDALGPERMGRLWAQASAQHEEFVRAGV